MGQILDGPASFDSSTNAVPGARQKATPRTSQPEQRQQYSSFHQESALTATEVNPVLQTERLTGNAAHAFGCFKRCFIHKV